MNESIEIEYFFLLLIGFTYCLLRVVEVVVEVEAAGWKWKWLA